MKKRSTEGAIRPGDQSQGLPIRPVTVRGESEGRARLTARPRAPVWMRASHPSSECKSEKSAGTPRPQTPPGLGDQSVVSRQVVEIPLADLPVVFDYAIAVTNSS
jgi:hypothetical protein